jgi:hypothetical protein
MPAVVNLESFDGTRILESGQGFFVTEDIIATRILDGKPGRQCGNCSPEQQ